ncbi:MAG: phosphotransferase [Planctomycetes bacterium]|nr:phosphotransferase [Planctomycetota bacterium]
MPALTFGESRLQSSAANDSITPTPVDMATLHAWLEREVEWGDDLHLRQVRLNRMWAGRHGTLSLELALDLTSKGASCTHLLQGVCGSDELPRRSHRRAKFTRHGLSGLRLASDELGLWCCTPDRDPKLKVVRELLHESRAATVLAATAAGPLLGLDRAGARVRCKIAGYRAGRRCALQAWTTDAQDRQGVFVKVFRRAPTTERIEALRRLTTFLEARSHGRVRAPALVDFRPAERLLITEAIPGETSSLGMGADDLSEAANALAIVHDAPIIPRLTVHTAQDEFQTVCRWVPALRVAGEGRYVRLRELVVRLGDLVTTLDEQGAVLIHRDFFAAQLPRQGKTLWVVDLDTLSVGHPELDVATFLAHLFLDGLTAGVAPDEITEAAGRFVEAYRRSGGRVANHRLRFYLPCALARLGAIHAARDVPAGVVDELWRMAESHLADFRPWG